MDLQSNMTGILTRRKAESETHRDNSIWQQRKRLERHSYTDLLTMPTSFHVPLKSEVKVPQSCLTLCDPMGCSPWNSPGQKTGVDSISLLQGIFPSQVLNPGLLRCRRIFLQLSHKGSPGHLITLIIERLSSSLEGSFPNRDLCDRVSIQVWTEKASRLRRKWPLGNDVSRLRVEIPGKMYPLFWTSLPFYNFFISFGLEWSLSHLANYQDPILEVPVPVSFPL